MSRQIKIYADGADLSSIRQLARRDDIAGFTTNPSLARKAGVSSYLAFCAAALDAAAGKPVSLEVLETTDADEIYRQAHIIAGLGDAAVVKVPIIAATEDIRPNDGIIRRLAIDGLRLNVTAIVVYEHLELAARALAAGSTPGIISVFAGRVADVGIDPVSHMLRCRELLHDCDSNAQLLWASPRQAYDVVQAERAGCDIVTLPPDLIARLEMRGYPLLEVARAIVEQFARDAKEAGYRL